MYFALGLLAAGLLVLVVAPAVWRRAARLTRTRIEASVPLTRAEINADKDRLRADFAISTRRLEVTQAQLNDKLIAQSADLTRRQEQIAELTGTRDELTAKVAELEERIASLSTGLAENQSALAIARTAIEQRDGEISYAWPG